MAKDFTDAVGDKVSVSEKYVTNNSMGPAINLIDIIFSITIAIMMFLCFFSLVASMSANLYDQSKEIGILRAMGVTKGRIRILFFYEALILVFASCLLGIFVGTVVGFTMTL